jgi:hypothetical protein
MLMTYKKLQRGIGHRFKSWPWLCAATLSGLMLSSPILIGYLRRRTYKKPDDWMNAYVRGCLDSNGPSL